MALDLSCPLCPDLPYAIKIISDYVALYIKYKHEPF